MRLFRPGHFFRIASLTSAGVSGRLLRLRTSSHSARMGARGRLVPDRISETCSSISRSSPRSWSPSSSIPVSPRLRVEHGRTTSRPRIYQPTALCYRLDVREPVHEDAGVFGPFPNVQPLRSSFVIVPSLQDPRISFRLCRELGWRAFPHCPDLLRGPTLQSTEGLSI